MESWEPKQSAGIQNKAVGHIVEPKFTFKVWRIEHTRFLAKSKFLVIVTKTKTLNNEVISKEISWLIGIIGP